MFFVVVFAQIFGDFHTNTHASRWNGTRKGHTIIGSGQCHRCRQRVQRECEKNDFIATICVLDQHSPVEHPSHTLSIFHYELDKKKNNKNKTKNQSELNTNKRPFLSHRKIETFNCFPFNFYSIVIVQNRMQSKMDSSFSIMHACWILYFYAHIYLDGIYVFHHRYFDRD